MMRREQLLPLLYDLPVTLVKQRDPSARKWGVAGSQRKVAKRNRGHRHFDLSGSSFASSRLCDFALNSLATGTNRRIDEARFIAFVALFSPRLRVSA
ncbi:MAG: hypothetical protein JWP89_900 [Schlesneria sp.]|nr:hypothetical protein [Schlesneria sp.]